MADDASRLVGGWTVTGGEKFGKPEPAERVLGTSVRFTPDRVMVSDKTDRKTYSATYQVDAAGRPWKIAMTADDAPDRGDQAVGLVEVVGDTARLVYSLPGAEPPTGFRTGPGQLLFEMKRADRKEP